MNKTEFVNLCAEKLNMPVSKTREAVNTILETIEEVTAENGKLTLMGFGTFEVKERKVVNFHTKEKMRVKVVNFHPSSNFKQKVRKG